MNLQQAIGALGPLKSDVAFFLTEEEIKGDAYNCVHCPISVYLRKQRFHAPSVTPSFISVGGSPEAPEQIQTIPTPSFIQDFLRGFDAGEYPFLRNSPEEEEEV